MIALLGLVVGVSGALAATADPFGAPEVSDPILRPLDFAAPVLGADAAGNAYWLSFVRNNGQSQAAVYERCAGGPWQPALLGPVVSSDVWPVGLKVAANGTAMVVWRVVSQQSTTLYSAVRPAGGAWGAPQTIPADADVTSVQFALSDAGAAVASWADSSPAGTWASVRPADGSWGTAEQVIDTTRDHAVAMSAAGDAIVLFRESYPGVISSSYRPAVGPGAGTWGL